MTAGGRRRGPRGKRRWGQTPLHLPPAPPPEGIDLVIGKIRADGEIGRDLAEERREEERTRNDLAIVADGIAELTRPQRDQRGRIIVDRRDALVGALVVAIVAGVGFWVVVVFLSAPSSTP